MWAINPGIMVLRTGMLMDSMKQDTFFIIPNLRVSKILWRQFPDVFPLQAGWPAPGAAPPPVPWSSGLPMSPQEAALRMGMYAPGERYLDFDIFCLSP